jgi:uncharacterized protein
MGKWRRGKLLLNPRPDGVGRMRRAGWNVAGISEMKICSSAGVALSSMMSTPPGSDFTPVPSTGWLGMLRLSLRRQSRKLYRLIRHPRQRRKGRIREWLGARIHNRDLWRFKRGPVANGLAGGLFFSMLPLPMQSIFAAAVGIGRGWHLPSAIVATWISNPFTYVPMFMAAKGSVMGLYHLCGAEAGIRNLTPSHMKDLDWNGFWKLVVQAGPELLLGYVLVGLGCAVIGYALVHGFWWLVRGHEDPDLPARPDRAAKAVIQPE